MKRLFVAVLTALILFIPASGCLASQTASFVVTVSVPQSPLLAVVRENCTFVVAEGEHTASCSATILMAQPTLEENGWRLALAVTGVHGPSSEFVLPGSTVSLTSIGSLAVNSGQMIDSSGGPFLSSEGLLGTFASPRTIVTAEPGFGNGVYATEVHFTLTLPDNAPSGSYVPDFEIGVSNNAI